jgi:HK97 family phage major capsid protein
VDLEKDIIALRSQLATAKTDEARERTAADSLVKSMRDEGINVLGDADAFEKVDAAYLRADELKDTIFESQRRIARALEITGERADSSKDSVERREARTIAARLLESDQYVQLRESGVLRDSGSNVRMNPVSVANRDELINMVRMRTTIDNSAGSGGGVIWSDRLENLIVPMVSRKPRLLDIISVGTTDSDTVEFVRQTTKTDAAAGTAYGTALSEAAYGYTKDSTTVKRVGHWVPSTKGAIADSGQLQTLVSGQLVEGHLRAIETNCWSGDGIGENLLGLTEATRSFQTQAKGNLSYHDVFHKAITKVRVANLDADYFPSAFVVNPYDYESIVLEKDKQDNYLNGRGVNEITSLWGMLPVVTNLATSGTAWVGDFSQAMLWVREGVTLAMSDSYSDYFLKGLVALKTEGRLAFDVLKGEAFVKITGL